MSTGVHPVKATLLGLWGLVLFSFTVVLSGGPFLVLRKSIGAIPFWLFSLGAVLLFFGADMIALALLAMAVLTLIGTFYECRSVGESLKTSSLLSLILSGGAGVLGFSFWALTVGDSWYSKLVLGVDKTLESAQQALSVSGEVAALPITTEEILAQAPSALVIVLLLTLFFAVMTDQFISKWVGLEEQDNYQLKAFQLPDFVIWIFIASLLGTFLETEWIWVQNVSANVFNVILMLYFFQGFAILFSFFHKYQINVFWRAFFVLFLLISRGFVLISFVGLMDFWVDFRARFLKETASTHQKE